MMRGVISHTGELVRRTVSMSPNWCPKDATFEAHIDEGAFMESGNPEKASGT